MVQFLKLKWQEHLKICNGNVFFEQISSQFSPTLLSDRLLRLTLYLLCNILRKYHIELV